MPLILPYTAEVLVDLAARYGAALWPLQAVALALAVLPLVMAWRGSRGRAASLAVGALLALGWGWVAWGFFWHALAPLDFMAPAYAGGFAVQAALVALAGALGLLAPARPRDALGWAAVGLCALAWAGLPAAAVLAGQPAAAAPVAGLMPGPTAALALAVVALAPRPPIWLLPIPLAWGVVAAYQGLVLGLPTAWFAAALVAAGVAAALARRLQN